MKIGAVQRHSLIDFPGKIAAVIFLQGCNWRCPFCHNPSLVLPEQFEKPILEESVFRFLKKRREKLDGVVISGGEPTIHKDLPVFIRKIKELGFSVKLDTNGSDPEMLRDLIDQVPGVREEMLAKTPLGRMATPHDQANAAVFLASDLASHITGEQLVVSGGEFMA